MSVHENQQMTLEQIFNIRKDLWRLGFDARNAITDHD